MVGPQVILVSAGNISILPAAVDMMNAYLAGVWIGFTTNYAPVAITLSGARGLLSPAWPRRRAVEVVGQIRRLLFAYSEPFGTIPEFAYSFSHFPSYSWRTWFIRIQATIVFFSFLALRGLKKCYLSLTSILINATVNTSLMSFANRFGNSFRVFMMPASVVSFKIRDKLLSFSDA